MANLLQYVDLSCHTFHIALTFNAVLLKNLDRDFFSTDLVSSYSNFSKGALSERSTCNITIQFESTSLKR